jgi:hypothetical protein
MYVFSFSGHLRQAPSVRAACWDRRGMQNRLVKKLEGAEGP